MTSALITDITAVRAALMSYTCESHLDIAAITGLSIERVRNVIGYIRLHSDDLGWSVPHQARGQGVHQYLVVEPGAANLTDAEYQYVKHGQRSTLRTIATMGENQG